MTAPTQVDEDLIAQAREVARAAPGLPSGRRLRAALGIGPVKAKAVLDRLAAEQSQRSKDRRRAMRAMRAGSYRTGSAHRPAPRSGTGLRRPVSTPSPLVLVPPLLQPRPVEGEARTAPVRAVAPRSEPVVRRVVTWPALLVAAPAFVAIWAGWVSLGRLTGFGRIQVLPGFGSGLVIDTAITLPVGVEAYAAYAFYVWLHPGSPRRARVFAAVSSVLATVLGMGGQTAFHLMAAAGMKAAPWQITTVVSCLPVAVFGLAATLIHLVRADRECFTD